MVDESGEAPKAGSDQAPVAPMGIDEKVKGDVAFLSELDRKKVEDAFIYAGIITKEGLEKARADGEMIKRGETPLEHVLPDTAPSLQSLEAVLRSHGLDKYVDGIADLPTEERRFKMYKLSVGLFNDRVLKDELGISNDSDNQPSSK